MIKITNLNFQNQTIENIDVDGESINNLEIKLTKTKFNIVIVKEDGKSIKKEIKKKNVPEFVDLVMDELEEEIEAVVIEPVEEEPVVEPVVEEPFVKEPVGKEPVIEEPVVEPVGEEPVIEEPVVEEPIMEVEEEHVMITLGK